MVIRLLPGQSNGFNFVVFGAIGITRRVSFPGHFRLTQSFDEYREQTLRRLEQEQARIQRTSSSAFLVAAVHVLIAPDFGSLLRATAITALVIALDALVVAPIFEHSYAMFRSVIGTWMPFALIFFASLAAGLLLFI